MNDEEEDQLTRVRRRLGATGPTNVAAVAGGIVDRLRQSGSQLQAVVRFKCAICKDVKMVQTDDGWKPCERCPEETEKKKSIF